MGLLTDEALVLQCFHQGTLELVGDQIAALGIYALGQSVADFGSNAVTGTGLIPEGLVVGIGSTTGLFIGLLRSLGTRGDGSVYRLAQFSVKSLLTLHAGDLTAQVCDLLLHLGIGGIVLCGQGAVVTAVGFQEGLGTFPQLRALSAQLVDSHRISS